MSTTRDYKDGSMELITRTHRQDFFGVLTVGGETTRLNIIDGQVNFSEDWSPRMQATLTVAARIGSEEMLRIDPREVSRLEIHAGYLYPGQEPDVHVLAAGHLDHRKAGVPGDVLELIGSSAETYLHECRWMLAAAIKSFAGVKEALEFFIDYAMPGVPVTWISTLPTRHRPDLVSGLEVLPGVSMWDLVDGITLSAGLRIYPADNGAWHLRPRASIAGVSTAFLTQSEAGIVLGSDDVTSRDGYYSAALIKYSWYDGTAQREILGTWAPAGPVRGAGQKTYAEDRPGPISQAAANEAARLLVSNLSTRGDSYVLRAVAAYWLRDGDTVQVRLANGIDVRHIVRSVSFNLSDGSMTVTTREPSNLGLN